MRSKGKSRATTVLGGFMGPGNRKPGPEYGGRNWTHSLCQHIKEQLLSPRDNTHVGGLD